MHKKFLQIGLDLFMLDLIWYWTNVENFIAIAKHWFEVVCTRENCKLEKPIQVQRQPTPNRCIWIGSFSFPDCSAARILKTCTFQTVLAGVYGFWMWFSWIFQIFWLKISDPTFDSTELFWRDFLFRVVLAIGLEVDSQHLRSQLDHWFGRRDPTT